MRPKPSQALRAAARLVERESERFGCGAIARTALDDTVRVETLRYFARIHIMTAAPWWGGWDDYNKPEYRNPRIIGLCLAAAIAESEGR